MMTALLRSGAPMLRIVSFALCWVLLGTARGQDSADHYAPRTVLARPMPAITDPPVTGAEEAKIGETDLVIGVKVGGQARAYPINQLTGPRREIINDTLGGTAIAATW